MPNRDSEHLISAIEPNPCSKKRHKCILRAEERPDLEIRLLILITNNSLIAIGVQCKQSNQYQLRMLPPLDEDGSPLPSPLPFQSAEVEGNDTATQPRIAAPTRKTVIRNTGAHNANPSRRSRRSKPLTCGRGRGVHHRDRHG